MELDEKKEEYISSFETRRGRSVRLGLRILNILRPLWTIRMITPTKIISIRIRIIRWRKFLGNIRLFSYTIRLTNERTISRIMHDTSTNQTHILPRGAIKYFVQAQ